MPLRRDTSANLFPLKPSSNTRSSCPWTDHILYSIRKEKDCTGRLAVTGPHIHLTFGLMIAYSPNLVTTIEFKACFCQQFQYMSVSHDHTELAYILQIEALSQSTCLPGLAIHRVPAFFSFFDP